MPTCNSELWVTIEVEIDRAFRASVYLSSEAVGIIRTEDEA